MTNLPCDSEELNQIIKQIELTYDVLIYHAIFEPDEEGEKIYFLLVPCRQEVWMDELILIPDKRQYAFLYNFSSKNGIADVDELIISYRVEHEGLTLR